MGINMSRYIILLTIMGVLMSSVLSVLVNLIFGINLPDYPFGDFLLYILIFIPPFVLLYVDGNSIKDNSGKVYGGFKRIASFLRCNGENVPVKKHYLWLFLILLFLSAMVLISSIPAPELPQWYADKMLRMVSPPYLPWSLLMVSIFAPLFEEIIFRKILMDEFLESNPGLRSRFNKQILFEDYTADELVDIFSGICGKSFYEVTEEAMNCVRDFFGDRVAQKLPGFANGRDVRNYFEKTLTNQANRLAAMPDVTDTDLVTITVEDVETVELF